MSESTKTNAIVEYPKNHDYYNQHKKPSSSEDKKKMFKSPMNVIKVALYMLRRKGDKKKSSPSLPVTTNATLTTLVGSIRPLHLQSDVGGMSPQPPPPLLLPKKNEMSKVLSSQDHEKFEASPYHPKYAASSSSCSSSSRGGMSRFASAQSLYDLDNHDDDIEEDDDDEDAYYDGLEGDEMIDAKADMFIAKFYQQMRL